MVIDFSDIQEEKLLNFKGGEGELITRNYIDENNRIMLSSLKPGASSGYHKHDGNCEIVYILEGEALFRYDEREEIVRAGQVHYCPDGHSHSMINKTERDILYLAIVPKNNR